MSTGAERGAKILGSRHPFVGVDPLWITIRMAGGNEVVAHELHRFSLAALHTPQCLRDHVANDAVGLARAGVG
ncbi:hypothetical protein D9M68_803820 [compost metagenome]